jgi:hypothetical protein
VIKFSHSSHISQLQCALRYKLEGLPEIHEACGVDFNPAYPENVVLEVVAPGFLLGGKLLRSAVVVVNRLTVKEPDEPDDPCEHRVIPKEEEYYA